MDFLSLMIADMSFLSLHQKKALKKNIDADYAGEYDGMIGAMALAKKSIDDISFLLKKTFRAKWDGKSAFKKTEISAKIIERFGIKSVFYDDEDFPPLLKEMADPPFSIFYRGNFDVLKKKCVSVVGTRRATLNATKAATAFGKEACDAGFCVVSGLAFGIDVASHKGALSSETPSTCAVLPSGIDTITPASNQRIAVKILETGGLILSEYTPGTPGTGFRCVQRDRLIAALSCATVVIQAPFGSGALITAKCALDYGRDVAFHSVATSEESKMLDEAVKRQIEKDIALGKKWDYKLDTSSEKYIEEGAPVISDFSEFLECLGDEAGQFSL